MEIKILLKNISIIIRQKLTDKITMSQGFEKITKLENYINNNTIKIKYTVDDMKGQSMIPIITVTGRER